METVNQEVKGLLRILEHMMRKKQQLQYTEQGLWSVLFFHLSSWKEHLQTTAHSQEVSGSRLLIHFLFNIFIKKAVYIYIYICDIILRGSYSQLRVKCVCPQKSRSEYHLLRKEYLFYDFIFCQFLLPSVKHYNRAVGALLTLRPVTHDCISSLPALRLTVRSKLLDFKVLFDMSFL